MEETNEMKDSKHLISNIQSQYTRLSKGQKLIAQYILNNYDKVAFMTACKLGETVGVSESTVVRFANALGYSGYPKLQAALQELIKNKLTTVQRVEMAHDYSDDFAILNKVLKSDIDNIRSTLEEIDERAFKEASNKLLRARKIYILGMRSSFVVAQYLGFYLDIILDNVHIIRMDMGDAFEQIVRINEEDVIVAISFPRYSKKSYQIVNYAKEKGAHVISLTDSLFAPVASLADNTLLVKSNMASFVDSLVPALSISNALAISVGMKEKEDIKQHFDDLEQIWKRYSVYEWSLIHI
ncbi:MurR/RpiR family transcriptional regulator [Clostridioides difficile]|nr:MurR/RpiR family transcriptional regulator [Clostridioides difficile]PBH04144.1 N-acetylmannosamine kinase [Clostridioides difficile]